VKKRRLCRTLLVQLVFSCFSVLSVFAQTLDIQLAHNSPAEQQTKAQLARLLKQYDTSKYTFTNKIVIDEQAIPHSDPVLTLHTRHLRQDDELLSTYVHEQLHWFLKSKREQTQAAEAELARYYPKPPVGGREGSRDLESDYLHLIVCKLEWDADKQLLGAESARAVMNFWAKDHYTWVYQTVLADENKIETVIKRNHLDIT